LIDFTKHILFWNNQPIETEKQLSKILGKMQKCRFVF